MRQLSFCIVFIVVISSATALQCYSGSQLQVLDCPSISCIKQTLGMDTNDIKDRNAINISSVNVLIGKKRKILQTGDLPSEVRYCDGSGVSSVCQTYRIFETCDMIPNLGFICCCSGNLCNPASFPTLSLISFLPLLLFLWRL